MALALCACGARTSFDLAERADAQPSEGGADATGGASVVTTGAGGQGGTPNCIVVEPGESVLLAEEIVSFELALTDDAIFATHLDEGLVLRIDRCDGAVTTLASDQTINPRFPVLGADHLYWALQYTQGSIHRLSLSGGDPQIFLPDVGQTEDMGIDDGHLYFITLNGELTRAELAGGDVSVLPTPTEVEEFTIDETGIYTVSYTELWRLSKQGPNAWLLFWSNDASLSGMYQLGLDQSHVYFLQQAPGVSGGIIRRVPKLGGPMDELVSGLPAPGRLAVGAEAVFYGADDGMIRRFGKATSEQIVVATGAGPVRAIAIDGDVLFWTTASGRLSALGL